MGSQTKPITTTDVLEYVGELFFVGATFGKSPVMSRAGLGGGGFKRFTGSNFIMGNLLEGDAGDQDGVTENASIASVAATSYTGAQKTNYGQIFDKTYLQSYADMALNSTISGVALAGEPLANISSLATQRMAHLKQFAADYEYSALRGSSAAWTNAATDGKMNGVITGIEAGSETSAGDVALSRTLIQTEIIRMAAAGAEFGDMVMACGAYQLMALNDLYGNAIQSQTDGGVSVSRLLLPVAGSCELIYSPAMAADDLAFLDMTHLQPAFAIVPGKPPVFVEALARDSAGVKEQMYSIASVDYTDVMFHGMVSGLATT